MGEKTTVTTQKTAAKDENSVIQTKKTDFAKSTSSPFDRILFLQSTAGNRAVEKLLKSSLLQAKLEVSHPDDMYEREADRVADEVMRMPDSGISGISGSQPRVQRTCVACAGDERLYSEGAAEERTIWRKPLVLQSMPLVQRQEREEPEEEQEEVPLPVEHPADQHQSVTPLATPVAPVQWQCAACGQEEQL